MEVTYTKAYRKQQLDEVYSARTFYRRNMPKIKIIRTGRTTDWLDIEEAELEQIRNILLQGGDS